MGVIWVGEIACGRTDGENRRFLEAAEFALLGEMSVGCGKGVEYVLGQRGSDSMAEGELGMVGKGHLTRRRAGRGVGLCCVDEVGRSKAKILKSQKTIGVGKAAVRASELGGGPGGRVGGRERIERWLSKEEGVGEVTQSSQVVDGKRQKEEVV